jgi:drug/metabolite transporter (DMT)-like permease
MRDENRERILMVLSFVAIHTVWGSTYLAIWYAVETIPPLLTAGLHQVGGAALFAWCWRRGYRPTARQWRASLILSVMSGSGSGDGDRVDSSRQYRGRQLAEA